MPSPCRRIRAAPLLIALFIVASGTLGPTRGQANGVPSARLYLPVALVGRPAAPWAADVTPAGRLSLPVFADGRVYALFNDEVAILDVADPARPRVLGSLRPPDGYKSLAAGSGRLYVRSHQLLTVYDVADGAHPQVLGSAPLPAAPIPGYGTQEIALSGRHVLVADDCLGLTVLDVADPGDIRQVGASSQVGRSPVVLKDRVVLEYGHCSRGEATGFATVDLADPRQPRTVGGVPWSGALARGGVAWPVDVAGGPFVAVVVRGPGLDSSLCLAEALPGGRFVDREWHVLPPGATGAAADEAGHVFVSYGDGAVEHIEVATLGTGPAPRWTVVGQVDRLGGVPIGAGHGVLAIARRSAGTVAALDVDNAARPAIGGELSLAAFGDAWLAAGGGEGLAYVLAGGERGALVTVDPRPADPRARRLGELGSATWGGPIDMTAVGQHVYVLNRRRGQDPESLSVVDVADPRWPRMVGTVPDVVGVDLATDGSHLVIAGGQAGIDGSSGLAVFGLTDPAMPVLTGTQNGDYGSVAVGRGLVATGGRCPAVTGEDCVATFALTPAGRLSPLGALRLPPGQPPFSPLVALRGRRAFVLQRLDATRTRMTTVDLTEPARPSVLGGETLALAEPGRLLALPDGRLFASGTEQAILAIDPDGGVAIAQRFAQAGLADVAGEGVVVAARGAGLWYLGPPRR